MACVLLQSYDLNTLQGMILGLVIYQLGIVLNRVKKGFSGIKETSPRNCYSVSVREQWLEDIKTAVE